MKFKKIFKGAGVVAVSVGMLTGCGNDEGVADGEYLTDTDLEGYYTEEDLSIWAEEQGFYSEEDLNAWAEEQGFYREEDLNLWAEEQGLLE